jgi:hypothetical protein
MFFIIVAAFSPYNGAVTIQSIIPAKSSIINHPSFITHNTCTPRKPTKKPLLTKGIFNPSEKRFFPFNSCIYTVVLVVNVLLTLLAFPYFRTSLLPHFCNSALLHFHTSALPHFRTSALLHFRTSALHPDHMPFMCVL